MALRLPSTQFIQWAESKLIAQQFSLDPGGSCIQLIILQTQILSLPPQFALVTWNSVGSSKWGRVERPEQLQRRAASENP